MRPDPLYSDRLRAVAAAANDLNDELTVILNQAVLSGLTELQHSALRCAAIARNLLLISTESRRCY